MFNSACVQLCGLGLRRAQYKEQRLSTFKYLSSMELVEAGPLCAAT